MLRRITDSDRESADDTGFTDAVTDAVNKLVDNASTPAKPQSVDLLTQSNVQLIEFDIQVPDPWTVLTLAGTWVNVSTTVPLRYMKHYDGSVELSGNVKSGGVGTTISTLPVGMRPDQQRLFGSDDGAGAHAGFYVNSAGVITATTAGTAGLGVNCRFLSADMTPVIQSCWPKLVSTKLPGIAGVVVVGVSDGGAANDTSTKPAGNAYSVDFQTTTGKDSLQLRINNIMGLPYNRKSHITILAIGQSS